MFYVKKSPFLIFLLLCIPQISFIDESSVQLCLRLGDAYQEWDDAMCKLATVGSLSLSSFISTKFVQNTTDTHPLIIFSDMLPVWLNQLEAGKLPLVLIEMYILV